MAKASIVAWLATVQKLIIVLIWQGSRGGIKLIWFVVESSDAVTSVDATEVQFVNDSFQVHTASAYTLYMSNFF